MIWKKKQYSRRIDSYENPNNKIYGKVTLKTLQLDNLLLNRDRHRIIFRKIR